MVTLSAPNAQDCVALAEIELCGELMIAASAAREERLSPDRIDEVLNVGGEAPGASAEDDAGPVPAPVPVPWTSARLQRRGGVDDRSPAGRSPAMTPPGPGPDPGPARAHVRSSRAIAFVASSTFASISSPPLTAASATQWRRCSSSSWRAKDCRALVEAETWVSMSMQ